MVQRKLSELDYYALLRVERTAPFDAIQRAFHAFALKYHPDRHRDDRAQEERVDRIYRRGTEAFRVLSNAVLRAQYDRQLAQGILRFEPSAVASERPPPQPTEGTAPGPSQPARAMAFLHKAEQALAVGDRSGARLLLRLALTHDPDNATAQRLLAAADDRPERG